MPIGNVLGLTNKSQMNDIANKVWNDFLHQLTVAPWVAGTPNSGTNTLTTGTSKHPGVAYYASSTSANSGARLIISPSSILLSGNEKPH